MPGLQSRVLRAGTRMSETAREEDDVWGVHGWILSRWT